jgi:putative ubiquitin-RnfH superfamily antitoxin RatB of RatAB toxin-antitoxin module
MAESIGIEVVYAGPQGQRLCRLSVPKGTTAAEAVTLSGLLEALPRAAADTARLGIFSRRVEPGQVLEEGDRVELYRPLILDPMEARRRRARRGA